MKKLTYYLHVGNEEYKPFYEYSIPDLGADEIYARQLCTYFIMKGTQYELKSNEMVDDEDILVLEECGKNETFLDEEFYRGKGLYIEFRRHRREENHRKLTAVPCATHFDIIRFLLKDIVDVPGFGQMEVTSTEIDEDRAVYVVYVKAIGEVVVD